MISRPSQVSALQLLHSNHSLRLSRSFGEGARWKEYRQDCLGPQSQSRHGRHWVGFRLSLSIVTLTHAVQCRLCLGIQRLLPSWPWQSSRRLEAQSRPTGTLPASGISSRSALNQFNSSLGQTKPLWPRTSVLDLRAASSLISKGCSIWLARCVWRAHPCPDDRLPDRVSSFKWKNSGEGSSGSPYSSFRFIQDIMCV